MKNKLMLLSCGTVSMLGLIGCQGGTSDSPDPEPTSGKIIFVSNGTVNGAGVMQFNCNTDSAKPISPAGATYLPITGFN